MHVPSLKKLGYSLDEITSRWASHYSSIRDEVLRIMLNHSDGIFAGIQDKRRLNRHTWTSERLGNHVFKESLLQYILPSLDCSMDPSIIYDRGGIDSRRTNIFNQEMIQSSIRNVRDMHDSHHIGILHDVDLLSTLGIWASDFVAGAFHLALKHENSKYRDALKPKFIEHGYVKF